MLFPKKNENVFQLSLTELAFTLIFILLLLAGLKLGQLEKERTEAKIRADIAESKLQKCQGETKKANVCEKLQNELERSGLKNPEDVISKMVKSETLENENKMLTQQVDDLETKLSAMKRIEKEIKSYGDVQSAIKGNIDSALKFKSSFEKHSKKEINKGDEETVARHLAKLDESKEKSSSFEKDLKDCNGKLTFCTDKLSKSGYGLPPCWTDAAGKQIHYLFNVEIIHGGVLVSKAWPPERDEDAANLPDIELILDGKEQSLPTFKDRTFGIFKESKVSSPSHPECRHYVILKRSPELKDIDEFNRLRLGVEDHFYKLDLTQQK